MHKHRARFLVLALSALIGFAASEARAASISMTITLGDSSTILVDSFITSGATPTSYGNVNLTLLNLSLAAHGSEYSFTGLGGGSNNAGDTLGLLTLNGGIQIIPGSGHTLAGLTITETEGSFTSPMGPSGTLLSTSTGNFNSSTSGTHDASSTYNATPTAGPYTVTPNALGNGSGGALSAISPFVTPYMLTNTISFSLVPSSTVRETDQFGVTARVSAIPEPASVVMLLTGMPLPLAIVFGLIRRRRAEA
jgi:hypothetical protein